MDICRWFEQLERWMAEPVMLRSNVGRFERKPKRPSEVLRPRSPSDD